MWPFNWNYWSCRRDAGHSVTVLPSIVYLRSTLPRCVKSVQGLHGNQQISQSIRIINCPLFFRIYRRSSHIIAFERMKNSVKKFLKVNFKISKKKIASCKPRRYTSHVWDGPDAVEIAVSRRRGAHFCGNYERGNELQKPSLNDWQI